MARMKELRKLTDADLVKRVRDLKEELFNLNFQAAVGQLTNTARVGKIKVTIAQIKTVQTQRKNEGDISNGKAK